MKALKVLTLCLCAVGIAACSSDDDNPTTPTPTTKEHAFTAKKGDYATYTSYRLDENDEIVTTTASYSSRTVLQTGLTYQGQSDVIMAVDTTFMFGSTTEVERVDTLYYRTDNGSLYIYNFAQTFASLIPTGASIQIEAIAGWAKVADLRDNASSFNETIKIKIFGVEIPVAMAGQNKGKQTIQAGGKSYTAFHQELTGTGTVITSTVSIPFTVDMGGVKGATDSPSTLIAMTIKKFNNPFSPTDPTVNGRTQVLTSFTAGS